MRSVTYIFGEKTRVFILQFCGFKFYMCIKLILKFIALFQFDPTSGNLAKDVEWSSDNKRDLWFYFFLLLNQIFKIEF